MDIDMDKAIERSRMKRDSSIDKATKIKADTITNREELVASRNINSILFIDDSSLVLETVKRLMGNSPFELLVSDDPFKGLCILAKHKPRAVFIDANMHGLSGYQFCALVKAQLTYRHILCILVLEQANKLLSARAIAAGANSVLVKPFGKNELIGLSQRPGEMAA